MTLVTVGIPTYRRDDYLGEALESVLAQTVTDIEIIVSDNGNSPATRALVESYADPRIAYSPLPENIGHHGNLTRCLHLGSAPYVTVLADDDTMYPTNLERKLAALEEYPSAGLAHAAFDQVDHLGAVTDKAINWTGEPHPARFETGREFIERAIDRGNRVCSSSAVLRRMAVGQLGQDREDGGFSDLGLWLRMAVAWDFGFVDEPLTTVRIHGESISAQSGLHELDDEQTSMATLPMTVAARSAKFRFLDEYAPAGQDRRFLRHLVRDRARTELKKIVADATLAHRRPFRTMGALYRAARVEPSLWWSPWSAVLLASSVFGRELFDTAVEIRSSRQ